LTRPFKHNSLEVVVRIRSPQGAVLSEHTIRGDRVEMINYFPSGAIWETATITLEQYVEELDAMKAAK
jgi:hypothetical protein